MTTQAQTNTDAQVAPHSGRAAARRISDPGLRMGRGRPWALALGDMLAVVLGMTLTFVAGRAVLSVESMPAGAILVFLVLCIPTWLVLFTVYRLYDADHSRLVMSSLDEMPAVFHAVLLGSIGSLLLARMLEAIAGWRLMNLSQVFVLGGILLVAVPGVRSVVRSLVLPSLFAPRRTVIVGVGPDAGLVRQRIQEHPEYGLDVVGFVVDRASGDPAVAPEGAAIIGAIEDLDRLVDLHRIDRVLFTETDGDHDATLDLMRVIRRPQLQVSIVPRYSEVFTANTKLDDLGGVPVVTLPRIGLDRRSRLVKRGIDVVASLVLLILLAPLLLLVALAVKLDSRGPALYLQRRCGRNGAGFRIIKFRTMRVGAHAERAALAHLSEGDGPLFKLKAADPRVTRLGAFLRKTSLDELPQLVNVLAGQMSLVGPRPFVFEESDQITGWARRRLDMTPGITGLWQTMGRSDMPFDDMCKLDFLYATNWSLWWDTKILLRTVPAVFAKRGAY